MTRRTVALSALSGLILAACFPSLDLNFLTWFSLLPLLVALNGQTAKQAFRLGGITGIVFFGGTIYWITNSVNFSGHIPLIPASLITVLLCAYCALFPALFGAAIAQIRRTRPAVVFIAAPAVWTTLELVRTHLFSGFPWSLLGYSQYNRLPVIQIADITGVYGISFLIVLVNAAIAGTIEDRRRHRSLVIAAAVMIAVLGYGYFRMNTPEGTGSIRIAVVQGNIEQDKKWDPAYQGEVIETYKRLTRKALEQKPDLVIWPETAAPFYFGGSGDNARRSEDLRQFVQTLRTPLLLGSATYERTDGRSPVLKNSAYLLATDGGTAAVYDKMHLVPFGEFVPLRKVLFFVDKIVQGNGDFQAGTEHHVMQVRAADGRQVPVGTVICYEIIFPDLVRRFVNEGATVMTTITNDAWFGRTGAPYQHFSMAVLRAVENRVPVARAANTGISGFVDAKGHILASSGIFTEAYLTRMLVPGSTKTFYTRNGDVFAWLCVLGTILAVLPLPRSK